MQNLVKRKQTIGNKVTYLWLANILTIALSCFFMTKADISLIPSSDQDVDLSSNSDSDRKVVRVFHGIYNTEDE
jgi:hypothetical protein